MPTDSTISLLLSLPIGIIGGLYSGLIVTRYSRFADLRNEALRLIRRIDYMQEGDLVVFSNNEHISELLYISSDLLFLKHRKAGTQISQLLQDIYSSTQDAETGKIDSTDYSNLHGEWQETARKLPGNKLVLWSLWGNI